MQRELLIRVWVLVSLLPIIWNTGCSSIAVPRKDQATPCFMIKEYSRSDYLPASFRVTVYSDGALELSDSYSGRIQKSEPRQLNPSKVCQSLETIKYSEWTDILLRGSELDLDAKGFPVVEVWSPNIGVARFSTVDERLFELVKSEFGLAMYQIDEILSQLFPKRYCLDQVCNQRRFGYLAKRTSDVP